MGLSVVLDLFISLDFDYLTVIQGELVSGVFQVLFLDQDALEHFRVKTKRGASLEAFFPGILVDILEFEGEFFVGLNDPVSRLKPKLRNTLLHTVSNQSQDFV